MGGALGLVITTDVPIEGRHAQPVYVDDSLPIVGPSRACVVITGEIPLAGGPPIPVRLAPAGTPAIGPAIPVYVVSGSLSSGTAPANTVLPAISGTLAIGSVLSTTDGTWTGTPAPTFTYQWKRNGVAIVGETNNTYTLTASDPGTAITVEVTATNASGSASATSAAVNPSSLLTGQIAYWTMNEASGNRADSVDSHTLIDNNTVTSAAGKIGNAAEFVGANSEYLSIADHADLRGGARDFTFDGWLYVTSTAAAQYFFNKGSATSGVNLEYALFMIAGGTLDWRMAAGGTTTTLNVGTISAATWTYFCVWYEVATGLLWGQINNNAAVSSALVGVPNTLAQPLRFGTSPVLGSFLTGMEDEVSRWNRILTGTERASRYNSGSGLAYPF